MLVSIGRRRRGTERKGNKPSTYAAGFGGRQFARALATQHSILIIHVFTSLMNAGILTFSARHYREAYHEGE